MYGPSVSVTHVRGTSWMHRLDPVAKFAWLIPAGIFCFTTYLPLPLFGLLLFGLAVAISAKIIKPLLRVLVLFTPITASIIVIQGLSPVLCGASCVQEIAFGPLTVYGEGLSHALSLMLRVASFQVLAFGLILSTHPSDLFASLARMRVPYLINFMISMTLQLVPVLQRDGHTVVVWSRSTRRARARRGADIEVGGAGEADGLVVPRAVRDALVVRGEPRVVRQRRHVERGAEVAPLLLARRAHGEIVVIRLEGLVRHHVRQRAPPAVGVLPRREVLGEAVGLDE